MSFGKKDGQIRSTFGKKRPKTAFFRPFFAYLVGADTSERAENLGAHHFLGGLPEKNVGRALREVFGAGVPKTREILAHELPERLSSRETRTLAQFWRDNPRAPQSWPPQSG